MNVKKGINVLLDLFYPIFRKVLPFQLYAYLAVGAMNTALNILLFAAIYALLPQPGLFINDFLVASYTISLAIAFVLTVPTGYWLAKNFAFRESGVGERQAGQRLGKYVLVVLQGLGSDYLLMKAMIVFLDIHPTVAKIISTVVVLTLNYLLQKYFTFKSQRVTP